MKQPPLQIGEKITFSDPRFWNGAVTCGEVLDVLEDALRISLPEPYGVQILPGHDYQRLSDVLGLPIEMNKDSFFDKRCDSCGGELAVEGYCIVCGKECDADDAPEGLKREEAIGDAKFDLER